MVIATPGHPLAGQTDVPLARLRRTSITREPGSGTRNAAERFFRGLGEERLAGMEESNEAIKQAVQPAWIGRAVLA